MGSWDELGRPDSPEERREVGRMLFYMADLVNTTEATMETAEERLEEILKGRREAREIARAASQPVDELAPVRHRAPGKRAESEPERRTARCA